MRADTFFARAFLSLAGFVCVFLATAALIGEYGLRRIVESEAVGRRRIVCDILCPQALEVLAQRSDPGAFAERIRVLGSLNGVRLTLVAADGTVVADSEAQGVLSNHAERPEVIDARRSGYGEAARRSTTTGRITHYTSRAVLDQDQYLGTIRAATESEQIDTMLASWRGGLLWFGLGALIVGLLASAVVARMLARPLVEMEQAAASLAAGNLDVGVRAEGPIEVRRLGTALDTMSRELRGRLENQRRARVQVETILASMAEGVVAVDREERVLLMNRSAAGLLGLSEPLSSGARLWEHLRFPELERALRDALAGKGPWHGDAASPLQDGRTLGMSVAPVAADHLAAGVRPEGTVALLSDVTAIRRLEQVRIDFVANVSHELRTPLAAVMGALETLNAPDPDPETRARFLDIASRNASRLHAIVLDLLDLSSIEAQGDRMPLEIVRVDAPLRTAASALVGAAESKGVHFELPPPPPHPLIVNGNAQRLEQVFTNLLENAIKYTPRGGRVKVAIRQSQRDVSIDVDDTGIGIPEADLSRVFERFYRVDRARSREMGGTGLGLAIVKHVVRAHGGHVSVKSREGVGSTFTVTLPLHTDADKTSRA